jgi:phosphoserine phosphatase
MDLVIQAPSIAQDVLGAIASLADAQGIAVLDGGSQQAYRLARIRTHDGIAEICAAAGIDYALVAADLDRNRVRVVAIDMDSTLITIECIDEIADMQGIRAEVAAITASAMRGEIDFRESLVRRVTLLAGLPVDALARVYAERVRLSPGAERMLAGFKAAGAKTLLVSGGFTFFTDRLQQRLGFDDAAANTLVIRDGKLSGELAEPIVDAHGKAARLAAMRARHAKPGEIVVAIGDGANDLPMLREADVSVAYRAKPVVRARATYAISHCGLDAALNLFR